MAQGTAALRTPSQAGAEKASGLAASASPREIALDIASLISRFRGRGRFTLRIENLPQGARLTAGRNNGDRTWSLASDELEGLRYVPPQGFDRDHVLKLRVVAADGEHASTLALIELPVEGGKLATPPAPQGSTEEPGATASLKDSELAALKSELMEERRKWEVELSAARKALEIQRAEDHARREQSTKALEDLKARCDQAEAGLLRRRQISEAEIAAAKRGLAAQAALETDKQDRAAKALEEVTLRGRAAEAKLAEERRALEAEFVAMREGIERKAAAEESELSAARKALELQRADDQARREQSAKALKALKARCDQAEAALLRQRQTSEAEIAAAKKGLAAQAALEVNKQDRAAKALEELTLHSREAEAKLAEQRRALEAEFVVMREAAERKAAAELEREKRAAQALSELQTRCERAEEALRSAKAEGDKNAADDAYVRGLNQEIKNLQALLVDRETAIARVEASLEQMQVGEVAKPAPAHWEPLPGSFRQAEREDEVQSRDSRLARDFVLVFALVAGACLLFFFGQPMLAQIGPLPDWSSLFGAADSDESAPATAPAAPLPPPEPKPPTAVVAQDVNLRAQPSTDSTVLLPLRKGTQVTIFGRSGNWDRVQVSIPGRDPQEGWAYGRYLNEGKSAIKGSSSSEAVGHQ